MVFGFGFGFRIEPIGSDWGKVDFGSDGEHYIEVSVKRMLEIIAESTWMKISYEIT